MSAILFDAPRVRDGRLVTTEIATSFAADGPGLPILVILSDWSARKREYGRKTAFRVEEVPTPDGRGFVLHRNPADVAPDGPDADTFYGVLVAANGQDPTCTCRGFQSRGYCRHHDAVRELLEAGHIDHPGERPADPIPAGPAPF
jgi:hypothetical protein